MNYERETSDILRRLGVNNSYVGFRYTLYGVSCIVEQKPRNGAFIDALAHYVVRHY